MLPSMVLRHACPGGDDAAGSGALADALTAVFVASRDALVALPPDGGVLLVVGTDEPPPGGLVLQAVRALTRGLAREFAPRRVNAVVGPEDAALLGFLSGPASAALTGTVFDVR